VDLRHTDYIQWGQAWLLKGYKAGLPHNCCGSCRPETTGSQRSERIAITIYAYPIQPGAGLQIQHLHRKILYNMPRGTKKYFLPSGIFLPFQHFIWAHASEYFKKICVSLVRLCRINQIEQTKQMIYSIETYTVDKLFSYPILCIPVPSIALLVGVWVKRGRRFTVHTIPAATGLWAALVDTHNRTGSNPLNAVCCVLCLWSGLLVGRYCIA
jgi:hypothetical protein